MKVYKCLHNCFVLIVVCTVFDVGVCKGIRKYTRDDLVKLREEVRQMFEHAYSSYLKYAYPYDELRPLSCDGIDTWGSYSLTLIDALDTLAVMGNFTEFQRVVDLVSSKANFDANINVSVFETNIRIVGGLLSAHLLSQRAGVKVEPGWPCNGPLLRLAEDVAKRLLAAFDTPTGMPYGTVNLRYGVPIGETSITCTAGVGTFIVEFGALSRLTGDPVYEEVALNALHALYHHRSSIGLYGNHIDVLTGRWTAQDSGIGAGIDSFFEYLVKGAILLQLPELMAMFNEGRVGIDKYLKRNDWYLWVSMQKGQVTLPVFQSLEAYWPGVLSLIGDVNAGMKTIHNYHQVWKQYGFTPEFYNIPQGQAGANRESYPLRPELIESAMYLYRATGDPFLLDIGVDILRSIQHSARTPCGYATIKDARDHGKENRMESFFLAETTKYLYLLFDPDNFIHNKGQHGIIHTLPSGRECVLDAGGYVFNTEAHLLDPGALHCCSEGVEERNYFLKKNEGAKGENLKMHLKKEFQQTSNNNKEAIKVMMDQVDRSGIDLPSALSDETEKDTIDMKHTESLNSNAIDSVQLLEQNDDEITVESFDVEDRNLSLEDHLKWATLSNNLDDLSDELKLKILNYCSNSSLALMEIRFALLEKVSEVEALGNSNLVEKRDEIVTLLSECVSMIKNIRNVAIEFHSFPEKQKKLSHVVELILNFSKAFTHLNELYLKFLLYYKFLYLKSFNMKEEDINSFKTPVEKESKLIEKSESTNWKHEMSYQVDDSERVAPVTRLDSRPLFNDPEDTKTSDTDSVKVPEFVSRYKISSGSGGPEFDPQQLLERIRTGPGYDRNISWTNNYNLLSCQPQPFLTRITLSGEFYNDD